MHLNFLEFCYPHNSATGCCARKRISQLRIQFFWLQNTIKQCKKVFGSARQRRFPWMYTNLVLHMYRAKSLNADNMLFEVFRDDFNQDKLSLNWTVLDDALPAPLAPPGDRQNIRLQGGMLHLERGPIWKESHIDYASRILKTQFNFHFKYGDMTIRTKVPAMHYAAAIVSLASCAETESYTCRLPAVSSLEWTRQSLVWYMDEQWKLNLTVTGLEKWPKMYISMGVMPSSQDTAGQNNVTNKSLPQVFLVDYVSVRQRKRSQAPMTATQRAVLLPSVLGTVVPTIVVLAFLAVGCRIYRRSWHSVHQGTMLHLDRIRRFQRKMSSLCDACGLDTDVVVKAMAADPSILLLEVPLASLHIST
ncbi:uncharacterized protein LOC129596936 [Paramacrobiotus metropolitanus]|uniref:uncharacterized protein LOC129596936 n=1 Tax=Paramacrobiotus metropolitanus TaxID=2943436 RepID=UPI0024462A00|nr:uncharacterized protein LOC129596936 [Paramacrobiotus metropolitanus]